MKDIIDKFKKMESEVLVPALCVGGTIFLGWSFLQGAPTREGAQQFSNSLAQQRTADSQSIAQMKVADLEIANRAMIAAERYKSGCLVATDREGGFMSLQAGSQFIDWRNGNPFPDGSLVCDRWGNTGRLEGGVIADMAWTGDRAIVQESVRAYFESMGFSDESN